MSSPLITIGLATFNAQDTVAQAFHSAVTQMSGLFEMIVVDDASTDATVAILEKLAQKHPEVRILCNQRNAGIADVRNRILDEARGEFLAYFDDDDISHPQRIERQLCRLVNYEKRFGGGAPVICHTARRQIYPDGTTRIERTIGTRTELPAPSGPSVAKRILVGSPLSADGFGSCAACSVMARTSTFKLVGGFDQSFRRSEDTEFCVRLAIEGAHFPGVARPLVIQKMTKAAEKKLELEKQELLKMLAKHKNFIGDDSLYKFCCEWTELKYLWLDKRHKRFISRLFKLGSRNPLLTAQRVLLALPGFGTNRALASFYREN